MSQRSDGSVLISAKITEEVFKKGLSAMQAELNRFSSSAISDFNTLSKSSDAFGSSLGRAAKTAVGLAAAYLSVSKIVSGISAGVQLNANLQEAQIGIAAVLTTTNKYIDAQGRALQGQEAFNAAMRQSKDIAREIDLATKTTVASEMQLLQATQATMAAASQQGAGSKETIKFLSDLGNAMDTFQLDLDSLSKEAFALLTGTNLGQSALFQRLKPLGVSAEDIKSWVKAGTLIDNVTGKLAGFSAAGEAMARTFKGRSRDLALSIQGIAEVVTKDLTDSLGEAKTVISELFYNPDTNLLTKEIKPLVSLIQDFASTLGRDALDAAISFASGMKGLSGFVDSNRSSIDSLGRGVKELAGYWDVAAVALAAHTATQKVAKSAAEGWIATQRQSIQTWREQSKAEADSLVASAMAQKKAAEFEQARVAWKTRQVDLMAKSLIGTKQEERAVAMLTVQQQKLAVADAQVAAATLAVDAAQTNAAISTGRLVAGWTALKAAGRGLWAAIGGLPGLLVTGIAAAVTYLATRQSSAEKIAEKYSGTIAGIKGSAHDAEMALKALEDKIASMSAPRLEYELNIAVADIATIEKQFNRFRVKTREFVDEFGERIEIKVGSEEIEQAIDELLAGTKSAKDFEAAVFTALNLKQISEAAKNDLVALAGQFGDAKTHAGAYGKAAKKAGEDTANSTRNATKESKELADALVKVSKGSTPQNATEALKYLQDRTKNTKLAKEETEKEAEANDKLAMALLRGEVAQSKDIEIKAQRVAWIAKARDDEQTYAEAIAEVNKQRAIQLQLEGLLKGFEIKIPQISTESGKSTSDKIKETRKEIEALNTTDTTEFTKGLADGLARIEERFGKASTMAKALKKEFTEAHAASFLVGIKRDLEELSGRGLIDKMTAQIDDAVSALEKLGPESEDTARLLRGLTLAATDNKPSLEALTAEIDAQADALIKANPELAEYIRLLAKKAKEEAKEGGEDKALQARLQFLEEYGRLSGNYGKAIELQTKLISERAKALRKEYPDLKANIDGWERLAKLEIDPSFDAGISRSAQKFTAEWTNAGKVAEKTFDTLIGGVQSVGSSAIDAVFGDAEFRIDTLFKDIAKQMMQIAMNQTIAGAMKSLFGGEDEIAAIQAKTEAELASIAIISAAKSTALASESAAVATVGEQWTIAQALQELATESTVLGSAQQEMAIAGLTAASTTAVETQTAVSTSAAAETAAAWAPAATTASIGSFGAAAALALVGIMAVMALMRGFSQGGYTGNGSTSDVAGVVHGGEFVLNAAATRSVGINNLDAINASGSLASVFTGRTSALSNLERPQSGGDMYVNVVNNSSDSKVSQQQSADANGNMRLDIIIDDIMAGKVVNGSTARSLQSAYGLRKTGFRV